MQPIKDLENEKMIKHISKINYVRNLIDFENNQEFSKNRNIIYAPNGVGKTNFSRAIHSLTLDDGLKKEYLEDLRSLETKDDSNKKVSIEFVDFSDNEHNETSHFDNILVFNSDFVDKIIRTGSFKEEIDGELEILLGAEENEISELNNQKERKEKEREDFSQKIISILEQEKEKIKEWDKRAKKDGRHMRFLSSENLDKNKIEEYKKDNQNYEQLRESFESLGDLDSEKDRIFDNNKEVENDADSEWLIDVLTQEINFNAEAEGELKEHISKLTDSWIREGLEFHRELGEEHCPFCKLKLDNGAKDVIEKYKTHIESEKAKLNKRLQDELSKIQKIISSVGIINNDTKDSFEKRSKDLGINDGWIKLETQELIKSLEVIKNYIENKINNCLFNESSVKESFDDIDSNISKLNGGIKENKKLINKVNDKLNSVGQRQSDLRESIAKRILLKIYNENKDILDSLSKFKKEIEELSNKIKEKRGNLPNAQAIGNIKKVFNYLIRDKIGIKKYKAEIEDNFLYLKLDKFDISKHTRKISEGEKTAIAFCYFVASSIQFRKSIEDFTNTVFVIDDPICSIGYGYFYGIGDIVKNFHKYINDKVFKKPEPHGSPQVILLTHNMQFFNLLSSQIFRNEKPEKITRLELESNRERLSFRLMKKTETMSEFHTALRRIKGFSENDNTENIGNDIRRVLETLCSFRGKELSQESVESLFEGQSVEPKLLSFANDKSHSDWNEHEDPNKENYKEASENLIKLLNVHYEDVLNSLPSYEKNNGDS